MLSNVKSLFIIKRIFSLITQKSLLKLVFYNKSLQSKLYIDINLYKKISEKYRIIDKDGNCKEYINNTDILLFEGKIKNGKKTGFGKEYAYSKLIFEGEFKDGKRNGPGKVYREDKLIFEGKFLNGKEWEGKGEFKEYEKRKENNESYFIGIISKGKINGRGKKYGKYNDLEYEGEFIDGKKNGFGKEYNNWNRLIYEGNFSEDKRNGIGKQYLFNELMFEGLFLNGERWEGKGKENLFNNLVFEGEYKKGKKSGKGKIFYENVIIFEGNYLDGERDGEGIEYYKNKNIRFKGEFSKSSIKNGEWYDINGKIVCKIKDGKGEGKIYSIDNKLEFEGEYKNGKYWNGKEYKYNPKDNSLEEFIYSEEKIYESKLYDHKGNVKFEGSYINGELKHGKEYYKNYTIFEGEYKDKKPWQGKIHNYKINKIFLESGIIQEGKWSGYGREYNYNFEEIIYEGEFKGEQKSGKGKKYNNFSKMEFDGEFFEDKMNGIFKEYKEGKLIAEREYKEDKLIRGIEYDEYGNIIFEGLYKNNKRFEGTIKIYYKNEKLYKEGEIKKGKLNGKMKKYYGNGIISFEGEYKCGHRWNGKIYNQKGELIYELKNGKGIIKEYNDNDELIFEGECLNGEKNGKGKEYYKGEAVFEGEYLNGQIWNGKGKKYDDEGDLIFEGEYLNGGLNGKCKYYDCYKGFRYEGEFMNGLKNGKFKVYDNQNDDKIWRLKYEGEFLNGELNGKCKYYYENGNLHFEGETFMKWNGAMKEYNLKNELIFEGEFLQGLKWKGKGKEYFEDSCATEKSSMDSFYMKNCDNGEDEVLQYEGEYFNGQKNGKGKEYNENGQLIFEGIYFNNEKYEGILYRYSDEGKPIFKVEMNKGIIIGKGIQYSEYNENSIEFEGEVINDKKWNGKIKKYNEKGEIITEGELIKGQFTGIKKVTDENGKLVECEYLKDKIWNGYVREYSKYYDVDFIGEYSKGKRWKGKGKEYYPNNKVEFEGEYDKGKRIKGIEYYDNGRLKYEGDYLNGRYNNGKGYNISGKIIFRINNGKGIPKDFYKNSLKYDEKNNYDENNDKINGKYKLYYDNRNLKFEGEFIDGKKFGQGKEFDEEGHLIFEGEYFEDEMWNGKARIKINNKIFEGKYLYGYKCGPGKIFDKDGKLKFEGEYIKNQKYKGRKYNEDGQIIFDGEYYVNMEDGYNDNNKSKKWIGILKEYDYKGDLKSEGQILYGAENGIWKKFEDNKESNCEYFMGIKHGKIKEFELGDLFEGEYMYGKKWKGKLFNYDFEYDVLKGEYQYEYGKKNGKAIEYFKGGRLRFFGEYLNDKIWNGKGYDINGELVYEIKNGIGLIEEYDFEGNLKIADKIF